MTKPGEKLSIKIPTPLPDMGQGLVPVEAYVSPDYFEREREKIFKRAWLNIGRTDEIPNLGDYFVREIDVLGTSVIAVRGKDKQVRVFHNVCVHRGMRVATCDKGNATGFVCAFHGWGYGLDGRLAALPGEEYFNGIVKRQELGLPSITSDSWNGFLFIHREAQPRQGLREFLGGLADDLEEYPFERFHQIARYHAEVKVNWKTFIDAFHEAYHVEMVHGRSIPDACNSPDNPHAVPTSVRIYGEHHSVSIPVNTAYKPTPAAGLAWKFGASFAPGDVLDLKGMNPSRDEKWWFDVNVFFPNFFVDVGPGWYFTYNFWPKSVDETYWEMNIYQLAARTAGEKISQEHTKMLLRDLLYEDLSTMEHVHKAMKSGAVKHLVFSDMELACRHQHWAVEQWVNRD